MIRVGIDRYIGSGLTIADKGFAVFALMKSTTSGVYRDSAKICSEIKIYKYRHLHRVAIDGPTTYYSSIDSFDQTSSQVLQISLCTLNPNSIHAYQHSFHDTRVRVCYQHYGNRLLQQRVPARGSAELVQAPS
jgi:hypothetical protein